MHNNAAFKSFSYIRILIVNLPISHSNMSRKLSPNSNDLNITGKDKKEMRK